MQQSVNSEDKINLKGYFDSLCKVLLAESETAKSANNLASVYREIICREFLNLHLPSSFKTSNGLVFDSTGSVTNELDMIVVDEEIGYRLPFGVPIERVLTVIEVNSTSILRLL